MKNIVLFVTSWCPHCHMALGVQEELLAQHPEWGDIPLTVVDEERDNPPPGAYDYYYVPTYYVVGVKVHEGHAEQEDVERVFRAALEHETQRRLDDGLVP